MVLILWYAIKIKSVWIKGNRFYGSLKGLGIKNVKTILGIEIFFLQKTTSVFSLIKDLFQFICILLDLKVDQKLTYPTLSFFTKYLKIYKISCYANYLNLLKDDDHYEKLQSTYDFIINKNKK